MDDDVGQRSAEPTTLVLAGEIGVGTIGAAHARLVEALRDQSRVVASIDEAAHLDLTGVQLLESARRTAFAAGGAFVLAEPASGDLLETLRRGGFLQTADQRAFWLNTPGEY